MSHFLTLNRRLYTRNISKYVFKLGLFTLRNLYLHFIQRQNARFVPFLSPLYILCEFSLKHLDQFFYIFSFLTHKKLLLVT